jgi:microcystin-dependent protein
MSNNCSNCFNGCAEIVSDNCVKYTGENVPELDISTGDSLSSVTEAIFNFLVPALDGTGIKPIITPAYLCDLVKTYLPPCTTCTGFTLNEILTAVVRAICDLQAQIDVIDATLTTLNADYDVDCLDGVVNSDDTHDVVQAVIDKLCSVESALLALSLDVQTNYVKKSELNSLIAAYLASVNPVPQMKDRMVPYTAVEYYGPLTNFDAGGVGLLAQGFDKIYLCNGQNGTPDKRGRIGVGVISVPGGGALSPYVDPGASANNPNYTLSMTTGANEYVLTTSQIPSHTHVATVNIVDPGHSHTQVHGKGYSGGPVTSVAGCGDDDPATFNTGTGTTGLTGLNVTVSNAVTGGGLPHKNTPPVLACYYIMYIP